MRAFHFAPLVLATALFPLAVEAQNILRNESFELPKIKGPVDWQKGADVSRIEGETSWGHFQSMDETGKVKVGLTDQVARTGTQSIYVDFAKAEKTKDAFLMSDLIPVQPGKRYRVSLWGKIDGKRPLTLEVGRPLLRLQVEFYQVDEGTQTGETEYRTQQIPGSPRRRLFMVEKWNEYHAVFKAPEDAVFMKFTFTWESPGKNGQADGMIYFDDAALALTEEEVDAATDDEKPVTRPDEGPALLPPGLLPK